MKQTTEPPRYMLASEAARRIGISKEYCRQLADRGLIEITRTVSGVRLFHEASVREFAEARQKKEEAK